MIQPNALSVLQGSTLTVDRRPEATKILEGPLKTHNLVDRRSTKFFSIL
jgi:hypothetical protein